MYPVRSGAVPRSPVSWNLWQSVQLMPLSRISLRPPAISSRPSAMRFCRSSFVFGAVGSALRLRAPRQSWRTPLSPSPVCSSSTSAPSDFGHVGDHVAIDERRTLVPEVVDARDLLRVENPCAHASLPTPNRFGAVGLAFTIACGCSSAGLLGST